jgi:hypothetical protein
LCAALTPLLERSRIEADESTDFHDRNTHALTTVGIRQRRLGHLESARGFGDAEQPDVVSQVEPEPFPRTHYGAGNNLTLARLIDLAAPAGAGCSC